VVKGKRFIYAGTLGGLSLVLSLLVHFPLIPQAPFLLYDPGAIPILVASFKFGPGLGVVLSAVVATLFMLIAGEAGPWGLLMNFLATGSYVFLAGWWYRRHRNLQGAIMGLVMAPLAVTGIMVLANLVITPIYLGAPREVVLKMLLPAIIPFNLLKWGAMNGAITFLIYKRISAFLESPLVERAGNEI